MDPHTLGALPPDPREEGREERGQRERKGRGEGGGKRKGGEGIIYFLLPQAHTAVAAYDSDAILIFSVRLRPG